MTDRKKYPNLYRYANSVDYPGRPPLDINMELVRLEQAAKDLEEQIEKDKNDQERKLKDELAKTELQQRIEQLRTEAAKPTPTAIESVPDTQQSIAPKMNEHIKGKVASKRQKKSKSMRIKAWLIAWRAAESEKSIEALCADTGIMSGSSYYDYQRKKLAYSNEDIKALGTTGKELWGAYTKNQLEAYIQQLLEKNLE